MSRGIGPIQSLIHSVLEERGALPFPTLAWEVATRHGVAQDGNLANTVYNNILRAAVALETRRGIRGPTLQRTKRSLLSFSELERWYPDRTRSGSIRKMRRTLLPHIRSFLDERGIKLEPVRSEDYVWSTTYRPHPSVEEVRAVWPGCEDLIVAALPSLDRTERTVALELIVRGREKLVPDSRVLTSVPFVESVLTFLDACKRKPSLSQLAEVLRTVRRLLPVDAYRRSRMTAGLKQVVAMQKGERDALTEPFKQHLLAVEPQFVRALEGHREVVDDLIETIEPFAPFMRVTFSAHLDVLIERSALKPLVWYALEGTRRRDVARATIASGPRRDDRKKLGRAKG